MSRVEVRGTVRLWLVPVAAVVVVLALVSALGGFRASQAAAGRLAHADEVLDLARWQLVVHSVELVRVDEYDPKTPPALRVSLRATNTTRQSIYGFGTDFITLATPNGPLDLAEYPAQHGSRNGDFDPDVPQEVTLDFSWPTVPGVAPPVVRVLVRDERQPTNYLFPTGEWTVKALPAAHLDLPCPDRR
jgi:hypothetical protein